jgi:hypothetical protein
MWNFSMAKALGLMVRTAPSILLSALVCFGISAALGLNRFDARAGTSRPWNHG